MFPQNFRALRLVAEEILRPVISHVISMDELMEDLETKATSSPTSKLWLENLVKPVFIMMVFVRAEREGEWPLHLWALQQMLPYFFAAGHHQYARYGTYYLYSMEKLHGDVFEQFMKGEHVMRHKEGLWNGIWSDMFVESTFMRYGKGPQGIIGVTMKPDMVKKWAYSMHICSHILQDLSDMADGHQSDRDGVISHKEEKTFQDSVRWPRPRQHKDEIENLYRSLRCCWSRRFAHEHCLWQNCYWQSQCSQGNWNRTRTAEHIYSFLARGVRHDNPEKSCNHGCCKERYTCRVHRSLWCNTYLLQGTWINGYKIYKLSRSVETWAGSHANIHVWWEGWDENSQE